MSRIYLSYWREDREQVEEIYDRLKKEGYQPWMDVRDIMPGANIQAEIEKNITEADIVLVFFSEKVRYHSDDTLADNNLKREIRIALDIYKKKETTTIFIIPIKLNSCNIIGKLQDIQGMDFFREDGWQKLLEILAHALAQELPQLELPGELVQACVSGECVLFAGADLSARAGFPNWSGFAENLLEWARTNKYIGPKYERALQLSLKQGEHWLVVDNIVNQTITDNRDALHEYLMKIFGTAPPSSLEITFQTLEKIGFSAVLTTTFDDLMEKTFGFLPEDVYTHKDAENLITHLVKEEFFLLKLNGDLRKPGSVLLGVSERENAVAGNLSFQDFIKNMFFSRTVLFVGIGLEEIEEFLEMFEFSDQRSLRHYALSVVAGDTWQLRAESLKRRYGIKALPIAVSDQFDKMDGFLIDLKNNIEKTKQSPSHINFKSKVARKEGLQRIILQNIGVFSELDLTIQPDMNIILGDNGVGKSTILKAIGIGICGKEAQVHSHRLIKENENEGKIILETDRREYVTQLLRKDSGAVVKAVGNILESENFFAVGFPPLRIFNWERPRGPLPHEGKMRSTYEDILPMVTGDLDPRTNKIKQWIINLDYYASKEKKSKGNKYKKILNDFFELSDRLAEGFSFSFKGVDLNRREVTVMTDDGEFPIEALSQGTMSLIGWIAILMQRLHEVYEYKNDPMKQPGLVLIDEIDAHMHPRWQLSLIPLLEQAFPKLQFLVTTHSPLLVGNSEPRQIVRLLREKDHPEKVIVMPMEESYRGWRADQILTAPPFNLESTRAHETQNLIETYVELASKIKLSAEDKEALNIVSKKLESRMPSPEETKLARKAAEYIENAWKKELSKMPEHERKKIIQEINRQVLKSIIGSEAGGRL